MNKEYLMLMNQEGGEGGSGAANVMADELRRLSLPDGVEMPDNTQGEGDEPDKGDEGSNGAGNASQQSTEYTPSKDWNLVKDIEGFEMPKDINAENEKELLKQFIAKKYGIETSAPELHPLARQIQDMAKDNPEISINDLVNTVSQQYVDASKMTVDQKIEFHLYNRYGEYDETENPEGLTSDDIKDYISKLTKIEKNDLAKAIEININDYNKSLTEEFKANQQKEFESNYNTIIETLNKHYSKLEQDLSVVDTVYGIPVNQDEHKVYIEEFKKLTIPDKATGLRGIDEILSNDVTLYKMFLLATKFGEDKVMELITKGKESGKEELMKKLKITPTSTGTRSREHEPNSREAEIALLTRPAR